MRKFNFELDSSRVNEINKEIKQMHPYFIDLKIKEEDSVKMQMLKSYMFLYHHSDSVMPLTAYSYGKRGTIVVKGKGREIFKARDYETSNKLELYSCIISELASNLKRKDLFIHSFYEMVDTPFAINDIDVDLKTTPSIGFGKLKEFIVDVEKYEYKESKDGNKYKYPSYNSRFDKNNTFTVLGQLNDTPSTYNNPWYKKVNQKAQSMGRAAKYLSQKDFSANYLSHGYEREKGILTNSQVHKNERILISTDIKGFFPGSTRAQVSRGFLQLSFLIYNIYASMDKNDDELKNIRHLNPFKDLDVNLRNATSNINKSKVTQEVYEGLSFYTDRRGRLNAKLTSVASKNLTRGQKDVIRYISTFMSLLSDIGDTLINPLVLDRDFARGRQPKGERGLPTGFSTSPILSNLYMYPVDWDLYYGLNFTYRMANHEGVAKYNYSRYADDITISLKDQSQKFETEKARRNGLEWISKNFDKQIEKPDLEYLKFYPGKGLKLSASYYMKTVDAPIDLIKTLSLSGLEYIVYRLKNHNIYVNLTKTRMQNKNSPSFKLVGVKTNTSKNKTNNDEFTSGGTHKKELKRMFLLALKHKGNYNDGFDIGYKMCGNLSFINMISKDGYKNMVEWMYKKSKEHDVLFDKNKPEVSIMKMFQK